MDRVLLICGGGLLPHEYVEGGTYPIHRRMPHKLEVRLLEKFEKIKENASFDRI